MTIHGRFMRQIHILSGFAALLAAALITLTGCDDGGDAKTLSSIAITTPPAKTVYQVGENLDAAGMVVTATYSDGSAAAVIGYTASGFDSSAAAANQTVTVSYTEGEITQSADFTVSITAVPRTLSSIAVTVRPAKIAYLIGEPLNTEGMVVTAAYSDGRSAEVSGYITSGFDSGAAAASQFVTVSYTEGEITKTAGFGVSIGSWIGYYWANEDELRIKANSTVSSTGSLIVIPQVAGYTGQHWYLNGVEDESQAGKETYVFNAAGKEAGDYTIGLRVEKDSGYYSAAFIVTVTN